MSSNEYMFHKRLPQCWVTKEDHEREALDKVAFGIDTLLVAVAKQGVSVVGLSPLGRVERTNWKGVAMPSKRRIVSK